MSASYQWALAINPNNFVPHLNVTPDGISRTGHGLWIDTPQLNTSETIKFEAGELAAIRAHLPPWMRTQAMCAEVCDVNRRTWIRWEQAGSVQFHQYSGCRASAQVYSHTAYRGMQYLICRSLQEIAKGYFMHRQQHLTMAFVERNIQGVLEL